MSNVTPIKQGPKVCRYGFTAEQALEHFEALRGDDSCIEPHSHLFRRMHERGILYEDVLYVLRKGRLVEGPSLSEETCWRVRYRDFAGGDDISVVVQLEKKKTGEYLVVVTVIHHDEEKSD